MLKKDFTKRTVLLVLILSLVLMTGVIPTTQVFAAGNVSHAQYTTVPASVEITLAAIPNSQKELAVYVFPNYDVIFSAYDPNYGVGVLQVYYSIYNGDLDRLSLPVQFKDNATLDLEPFIYSDNDMIVTWTQSSINLDGTSTGSEIAGSSRISLITMNSQSLVFNYDGFISNAASYGADNISTFNSRVTKIGGKILVSWVVCHNVENDSNSYGIEGLYYDVETNKFYSENNNVDADGNPVPMVFAKDCNYILSYAIAEQSSQPVTLFEEADGQTHISDVMSEKAGIERNYTFCSDRYKNSTVKVAIDNGNGVSSITDGASYASVIDSDSSDLIYYNKGMLYRLVYDRGDLESFEFADVSKTGDTAYRIVSKNGTPTYIAALQYEPVKTSASAITINGVTYTKTNDGKWLDAQNNTQDLMQENICFYYINPATQHADILSQRMLDDDGKVFPTFPSFTVRDSDQVACCWAARDLDSTSADFDLMYSIYDRQYLLKADYSRVNEAISRAEALNKDDYIDFSAVTDALDAVVFDKEYTEQDVVDGYADAILNAIDALESASADYSAVNAAIAMANSINSYFYVDFSAVTKAISAVDRSKNSNEQAAVDAMANAILDAIESLVLKDADYSEVDKAISKANALNKSLYKDFSAVTAAINAVVPGKDITEQSAVDAMANAIDAAIIALELKQAPKITEGMDIVVCKGDSAAFRSDAIFADFQKVLLDGTELDPDNYMLKEGSTIVILKEEFTKTLSLGKHTLSIVSSTGSADAEFTVIKSAASLDPVPKTADNSNPAFWITLLIISAFGTLIFALKDKTKIFQIF